HAASANLRDRLFDLYKRTSHTRDSSLSLSRTGPEPRPRNLGVGGQTQKRRLSSGGVPNGFAVSQYRANYSVDSISKPQASSSASGMYFEFLFRRAHSRSLVERMYWSGVNLYSFTTCSKEVTVG